MASDAITVGLLARGAHFSPRSGCSVLELASVLADGRWDSRPAFVHPALAVVAGTVNDLLPDSRRRLLVPYAPWLPGTIAAGHRAWAPITRVCVRTAHGSMPADDARAVLPGGPEPAARPGWRARRRARHLIRTALASAASLPGPCSEQALCQALADSISACRMLCGLDLVEPGRPLEDCPAQLTVEPRLMTSPGCDWLEVRYRAVPGQPLLTPVIFAPRQVPGEVRASS